LQGIPTNLAAGPIGFRIQGWHRVSERAVTLSIDAMRCGLFLTLVAMAFLDGARLSAQPPLQASSRNGTSTTANESTVPDAPTLNAELPEWKLEQIELRDGRHFDGLILRDTGEYLELDEVHRKAGKPLYLIKRRFPLALVKMTTRLEEVERKALAEQIQKFRSRSLEESQRMSDVALIRSNVPGHEGWHYKSPWFDLESRLDEELTRRAVVRIEQMFAAFALILPSSGTPRQDRLKIELFNTSDSYIAFQKKLGVKLRHPAFYLREQNILAAGADLSALAQNLANVRGKNAAVKKSLDELSKELQQRLQKEAAAYTQQGRSPDEVKQLVSLLRTNLEKELNKLRLELQTAERKNSQEFEKFTKLMFQRLYHEAFHAYLENFVFPASNYDVPRWLNEGLAQVFEEGVLEVGSLRLDIPSEKRLATLQKDLREHDRLPLAELLNSEPRRFLVAHEDQTQESERLYLYSWGLAHYLVIREPVLQGRVLARYVEKQNTGQTPQQRFEQMVGQPLDEFEKRWRATMLHEAK
jgi:hypothetical protein